MKLAINNKFRFQKTFAHSLGITENTLSNWIKGKTFPSNIITLTQIAKILDISLDWLILGRIPLKLESTLFNKVIKVANTRISNNNILLSETLFTNIYQCVYKEYI